MCMSETIQTNTLHTRQQQGLGSQALPESIWLLMPTEELDAGSSSSKGGLDPIQLANVLMEEVDDVSAAASEKDVGVPGKYTQMSYISAKL